MHLLWFLLIGLAAGWLAGKVMNSKAGLLANLVIGVLGAFLGGFLFRLVGISAGSHLLGSPDYGVRGSGGPDRARESDTESMMFRERIEAALRRDDPTSDPAWKELDEMAQSSPETAVELICGIAGSSIPASHRGWLAAGPLRSAIAAANPAEERAFEDRASTDPTMAMLLDSLVRYETKQRVVAELLEGTGGAGLEIGSDQPVTIPNIHEQTASQSLDQEAWSKIVKAIQAAPENQLFMLATTIVEPLLLRNESAFREAMLEQVRIDPVFRKTLSYCDLSFSETFLDELRDAASR